MNTEYPVYWLDKPYYSLNAYCQHTFHEKLYKIAIDAGMTCPNRDGTLGDRGCIFCSEGGSGDFAISQGALTISEQLRQGQALFGSKKTGRRFIAYFQAYTNTYAPVSRLRMLYQQALDSPQVAGISIATRPDCLPDDVLCLLTELKQAYPDKFIWIELGLQTIHQATADYIRRGYPLSCFEEAVHNLRSHDIEVIVHTILGLPGETPDHMLATIEYLNHCDIQGIKLQLLHILKHTDLADLYQDPATHFHALEQEEYVQLLIECIEHLDPAIVIHRLTGDGPGELLIAPLWSSHKRTVLNRIHAALRERSTWQGRLFKSPTIHTKEALHV